MSEVLKEAPEHEIVGNIIRLFALPGRSVRMDELRDGIVELIEEIDNQSQRRVVVDALLRLATTDEQPPLHPGIQLTDADKETLNQALSQFAAKGLDSAQA